MTDTLSPKSIGGLEVTTPLASANFNLLIYGDSGVGKTLLAGSASEIPAISPVLYISVESGTMTLKEHYPDIALVEPANWRQVQKIYDELYEGKHPYKTIVIDSLSEIQTMAMNAVLSSPDPSRNTAPKLAKEHALDVSDSPDMKDQNRNTIQMRRFVRAFRDLPYNTVFTALEMDTETGRAGRTAKQPKFTKTFAKEVPAFFDFVWYQYVKEEKRGGQTTTRYALLTQKTESEVAKSRISSIPQTIENPNMSKLYPYFTPNHDNHNE